MCGHHLFWVGVIKALRSREVVFYLWFHLPESLGLVLRWLFGTFLFQDLDDCTYY